MFSCRNTRAASPLVTVLLLLAAPAVAQPQPRVELEVEGGSLWLARNDVQIPNETGTRFSLTDLVEPGPSPLVRVDFTWNIAERHALRHEVRIAMSSHPWIGRVHLKDFKVEKNTYSFVHLGEGDIDWPETRKALHDIGYDGYMTTAIRGGDRAYLADVVARIDRFLAGEPPVAAAAPSGG